MKKILLIGAATLMVSNPTFAGGILTNTNQHASFLRMIARGASIDIDGVYSDYDFSKIGRASCRERV